MGFRNPLTLADTLSAAQLADQALFDEAMAALEAKRAELQAALDKLETDLSAIDLALAGDLIRLTDDLAANDAALAALDVARAQLAADLAGLDFQDVSGKVIAAQIAVGAITAGHLAAGAVTAAAIAADTITADQLAAGAITAAKIAAGAIDGKTITGALFRTAASGRRVQIDAADRDRVKWMSGDAAELQPGALSVGVDQPAEGGTGRRRGVVVIQPPMLRAPLSGPVAITMRGDSVDGTLAGSLDVVAPGGLWVNGARLDGSLDTTAPKITLGAGAKEVLNVACWRRNGVATLTAQFTLVAAKAAGSTSLVALGTLPPGFRPLFEAHGVHVLGDMTYASNSGAISLGYNAAARAAGGVAYVRLIYMHD